MKTPFISLILVAASTLSTSQASTRLSSIELLQQDADQYYQQEQYRRAKYHYEKLARVGDRYSQYRLSTMYLDGKAGRRDAVIAFAWAEVAAQDDIPVLVNFRDLVWDTLERDDHALAAAKSSQYLKRYGDHAIARNMQRRLRTELRNCTGSRLGASCTSVYHGSLPSAAGITPGNGGVESSQSVAANANQASSVFGGSGVGEVRNFDQYSNLRDVLDNIEDYLEERQRGRVELKEFEVIEEPVDQEPPEQAEPQDSNG